jgi:uncharacterized membrane protein
MRVRAQAGLLVILAGLAGTLLFGLAEKAPCGSGAWTDLQQYRDLCYSDIVPLYGTEQLQSGRLPYVDRCRGHCDEYPVLTMYALRLTAWPVHSYKGFFYANALLLSLAAGVTAAALYRLAGQRALYFALAPTLLVYGFVNWDLIAVALATTATLAFVRRRDTAAGILLGLGVAAKLYPVLLVVPFMAERARRREFERASRIVWWAAASWLAVDLPFMILAPHSWSEFFRYNATRVADWDSLWFIACDPLGSAGCGDTGTVNLFSVVAFIAASATVWAWKVRRDPETPRWQLGFPVLVMFLLANKVYSPQYGLWLLPWFALVLPELRWFIAFEAADMAVFVTRFAYFGHLAAAQARLNGQPVPHAGWTDAFTIGYFQLAVLVRAAILLGCVLRFVVRAPPGPREPVRSEVLAA